jgi:hypothetical protein
MHIVFKQERKANQFCDNNKIKFPEIWWCFGNSDESRILFYPYTNSTKPLWKMDQQMNITTICGNVHFGTYECYEEIKELNICVDKCLVDEIKMLNSKGIKTIGCCCGHGIKQGFIQVAPEYITNMDKLGYEQLKIDEYGNGFWCFKPKSLNEKCNNPKQLTVDWMATCK